MTLKKNKLLNLFKYRVLFFILSRLLYIRIFKHRLGILELAGKFKPKNKNRKEFGPQWYYYYVTKILRFFNDNNCLNKNLILFYLLSSYVSPAYSLIIGVRKKNDLESHCWIELNGLPQFENHSESEKYENIFSITN